MVKSEKCGKLAIIHLATAWLSLRKFHICFLVCDVQGDIAIEEDVLKAVRQSQADVVFHLASYGMSGKEMASSYEH